jgi:hypothetical protein
MRGLVLVALAACHAPAVPAGPASPPPPVTTEVAVLRPGPATAVATLAPNVPTPVLDGPFLVTTVNPGSNMDMAIAPSHRCDDPKLAWFGYSGGGVAVGKGQTLCVRSGASEPRTNGFSGHD